MVRRRVPVLIVALGACHVLAGAQGFLDKATRASPPTSFFYAQFGPLGPGADGYARDAGDDTIHVESAAEGTSSTG